ncbi:hypothetical protein GCK72_013659 [Caenorhabditis remanei]|uniref:Uncharacterized protein n=1 Tax=Caenorhabditis remanei TaxID=31234 RepID=A0A6A5GRE6_CAERE|nr:hypothetical protein GCK72_013659 [Caenorhabditis remanei]KAF1757204.1 hypothetical protein GCK72_013659 [Caenorhabditis remanei]
MSTDSDKYFFAGYRGFYTDGSTFLQIIGLGAINNQSFHVRESRLNERGIKLGDFLSATVPLGEPVKNFTRQNYKFKVNVDGNFASIEDQEADIEKNKEGILVFRTKTFGTVRSVSQTLEIAKYRITIRATKESEEYLFNGMKYCADVKENIGSSSAGSSSNSSVIVGSGFSMSNLSISGKRSMKAFVYNSIKKEEQNTYFLWICDNQEQSIFSSKTHKLEIGHFFEGIFEEKEKGRSKWQCTKYVKEIQKLMEGDVIGNKIELKTTIDRYEPGDGIGGRKPQVFVQYLGKIIDNQDKLPMNCVGRQIKTRMYKVGDDFKWVVTELL